MKDTAQKGLEEGRRKERMKTNKGESENITAYRYWERSKEPYMT